MSPGGGKLMCSEHQGPPRTRIHPCSPWRSQHCRITSSVISLSSA
eukprot:COSAG06_NODE_33941_length_482_cov_0.715405_1_plen_44_part_10